MTKPGRRHRGGPRPRGLAINARERDLETIRLVNDAVDDGKVCAWMQWFRCCKEREGHGGSCCNTTPHGALDANTQRARSAAAAAAAFVLLAAARNNAAPLDRPALATPSPPPQKHIGPAAPAAALRRPRPRQQRPARAPVADALRRRRRRRRRRSVRARRQRRAPRRDDRRLRCRALAVVAAAGRCDGRGARGQARGAAAAAQRGRRRRGAAVAR